MQQGSLVCICFLIFTHTSQWQAVWLDHNKSFSTQIDIKWNVSATCSGAVWSESTTSCGLSLVFLYLYIFFCHHFNFSTSSNSSSPSFAFSLHACFPVLCKLSWKWKINLWRCEASLMRSLLLSFQHTAALRYFLMGASNWNQLESGETGWPGLSWAVRLQHGGLCSLTGAWKLFCVHTSVFACFNSSTGGSI